MRQKTALLRVQGLDRNGWHEISVEAQSVCQTASLARRWRWRESWQTAFLAEDSPARRRLLTVRHRHATASRRSCRGHVGRCFRAVFQRIENLVTHTCADDHWWCVSEAKFHQTFRRDLFAMATPSRRTTSGFLRRVFLAISDLKFRRVRLTNRIGNQL
jgi:hypothetical protein